MAITNAEKQFRARARVKQRLASAALVESFRAEMEADAASIREGNDLTDYGTADLLLDMLDGDLGMEAAGPFLAKAMGLDPDPWPGLTYDALAGMMKGRAREAKDRLGLSRVRTDAGEADLVTKLRAGKHRDWLMGDATKAEMMAA